MRPSNIDWIWQWGIGTRLCALIVFCSLFLPWCGELKGVDLLRMDGFERLWWFPVTSIILLLLPFVGRPWWRFLLECLATMGITVGAAYLTHRFRDLRGVGLLVTIGGGVFGFIMAILGLIWSRTTLAIRQRAHANDDHSIHQEE